MQRGAVTIEVNLEDTPVSALYNVLLRGKASDVLAQLADQESQQPSAQHALSRPDPINQPTACMCCGLRADYVVMLNRGRCGSFLMGLRTAIWALIVAFPVWVKSAGDDTQPTTEKRAPFAKHSPCAWASSQNLPKRLNGTWRAFLRKTWMTQTS